METPIENYAVKIFVENVRGQYRACFKIGVQTFFVCERDTKEEAEWYAGCLKTAFDHYAIFLGIEIGKIFKVKDQEIEALKKELAEHNELKDRLDKKSPYFGSQQEEIDREQEDLTNSQM